MIETQQGYAVGSHMAALLATMTGDSASAETIARIESKLDAALGQTNVASSADATNTATASQSVVSMLHAATDPSKALGMCRHTGKRLSGVDHLKQSINIILTTLIGSRVMRRTFGSGLLQWIDQPQNDNTRVQIIMLIAAALDRWEPRFALDSITVSGTPAEQKKGQLYFSLAGTYNSSEIEMGIPV